jgi:hypothetical protein
MLRGFGFFMAVLLIFPSVLALTSNAVREPSSIFADIASPNDCDSSSYIDRIQSVYEGNNITMPLHYGQCGYSPIDINSDWYATMSRPISVNASNDSQVGIPPGSTLPYAHVIYGVANTTFNWTPTYCQARVLNETYYNTSSNTTKKYNYHYRELYWTDSGFPYQYPHHIVARKFAVYDVNRLPIISVPSIYYVKPGATLSANIPLYDPDEYDCGSTEDFLKSVVVTSTHNEASLTKTNNFTYQLNFSLNSSDLICHNITINATDNKTGNSTQKTITIEVLAPLQLNGIQCSYAARVGRDPLVISITVPNYNLSYRNCAGQNITIGSTVQYTTSNGYSGSLPIQNGVVVTDNLLGMYDVGTYSITFSITDSLNNTYSKKTYIQLFPKLYPNNYPTLACAEKSVI